MTKSQDVLTRFVSGRPHNLGMLLEFPEDLVAHGVSDLGIDASVLDIFMSELHTGAATTPICRFCVKKFG
jgi:hypothetical protein